MKKQKIVNLLLIIIIVISTIITGNPIVKNDCIINILTGMLGIYMIILSIKNKQRIIANKKIFAIVFLCLSSFIPLIFNSYISLNGTVYYIFRYISIFIICISVNYSINEDKNNEKYLINTIIFSGIILVLFGIDLLSTNITKDIVKFIIGTVQDQQALTRMYSLFLYSNTFAISVCVAFILSIGYALKHEKNIYSGIACILLSGVILSQSRTTLLILAFILFLYFIFVKDKKERYKLTKLLIVNFTISIIYVTIFTFLKRSGLVVLLWAILPITAFISSFIMSKISNNDKVDRFLNIKYLLIVIVVIIGIFSVLTCFKSELVLFNGNNSQIEIAKNIFNVEGNKEYSFELEIDSKSNTEKDNYLIEFIQRNKYADEVGRKEFRINNYSDIISFNMNLAKDIDWVEFSVTADEVNDETKMVIKSLKINGKEYVLNYKFLPTDLINQLKNIDLSQRSVSERFVMIYDGLKVIKKNWLFGIGGDGWQYKQQEVQTYYYKIPQMHSYIAQLWIEFGIIGILAYVYITIKVFKEIFFVIKNKELEKLPIALAYFALFMHSLIDFDLTFLYMLYIMYIMIAIILNEKKKGSNLKIVDYIINFVLIIIITALICFNCNELYVKATKTQDLKNVRTYEEKTKFEKRYIAMVPYNSKYISERIDYLDLYIKAKREKLSEEEIYKMKEEMVDLIKIYINIQKINEDSIDKYLLLLNYSTNKDDKELAYRKIEDSFSKHRYDVNSIMKDYELVSTRGIVNDENIENIIKDNIDKDIENLNNYEKCRITKKSSEQIIEHLKEITEKKRIVQNELNN